MAGIDAITVGPTILEGLANTQVSERDNEIIRDAIAASNETELPNATTWLTDNATELTETMNDTNVSRLQRRANEVFTNAEEQLRALARVAILNKKQPHLETL